VTYPRVARRDPERVVKNRRSGIWVAGLMGLCLSAGTALADVPPPRDAFPNPDEQWKRGVEGGLTLQPEPDTKPAEVAPERAVRLPVKRAERLDDGMYLGPVLGTGGDAQIQLTVVNGFLVEAFIRRTGEGLMPFDLISVGVSNASGIRLQGNQGNEFVRVSGEILDGERGFGTFDGVLGKKQVTGTWTVSRR